MNILVLNCGSSSVKYKLIEIKANKVLAEGGIEKIGLPDAFIKFKFGNEKIQQDLDINDHVGAIKSILDNLTSKEYGCIKDFKEIDAVGHRVVHGGEKFNKSVLINDEVIAKIKECYGIAPLHNPVNMAGIDAINEVLPEVPQVGVFDTAFHQTMPAKSYMYALPYKYYAEDGVRRYGFHGTSHRYVSQRVCEFLGVEPKGKKIITCHVGNGGSITAVKDGKSIDTSMGLTPTEGLMMGTRCGDVDPGALIFLMDKHNLSSKDMLNMVNKESGLAGISGVSSDMREITAAAKQGNEKAILSLEMYEQRITKYVGAFAAEMGGVDIIVFTGGVGEHQSSTRANVCNPLRFMGVEIDDAANDANNGDEGIISTPNSAVKVVVIPTDEEYMIAKDTEAIIEGREP
ncbi:MAG: acetate kinase [Sodaliphilus sp.]|nr:acetate kinase [Muribaculaceae bacterium]MCI6145156.1 acetate kinase [Bacteroidales bacterium]MDY3007889.1 acetate kinase [Sodaliphilus sp.]MCI6223961.1 acetate kinase [Bacteroidales bacterium]MCI6292481.1 acetate kinase [Bacteroidales bacterium]